jgi:hypothetical protein
MCRVPVAANRMRSTDVDYSGNARLGKGEVSERNYLCLQDLCKPFWPDFGWISAWHEQRFFAFLQSPLMTGAVVSAGVTGRPHRRRHDTELTEQRHVRKFDGNQPRRIQNK